MNFTKFFDTQKKLNENLAIDESLSQYKVFARKHVELYVEISELAKITKCYTYWVDTEMQFDKQLTLKTYITCLREIISLSLDNKHDDLSEIAVEKSEYCLSNQFLNLYIDVNDIIMSPSKDHFETILQDFMSLGLSLGLTESTITNEFCNI